MLGVWLDAYDIWGPHRRGFSRGVWARTFRCAILRAGRGVEKWAILE